MKFSKTPTFVRLSGTVRLLAVAGVVLFAANAGHCATAEPAGSPSVSGSAHETVASGSSTEASSPATPAVSGSDAAVAALPLLEQLQIALRGVPISEADPNDLANAVNHVVAANPKEASVILTDVLSVRRPDMADITGEIVGSAILGLGLNPSSAAIAQAVQTSVVLQPSALRGIIRYSVRAVTCENVPLVIQSVRAAMGGAPTPAAAPAEISDGKNVVALGEESDSKQIVPLQKHVAAFDNKGIVPLQGNRITRSDDKNVVPLVTQRPTEVPSVVGAPASSPANDEVLMQIVKLAFDARPECYTSPTELYSKVTKDPPLDPIAEAPATSPALNSVLDATLFANQTNPFDPSLLNPTTPPDVSK